MPADPQSSKVDERQWLLEGGVRTGGPYSVRDTLVSGPVLALGDQIEVVPASLVASLQEENERLRRERDSYMERSSEQIERAQRAEADAARLQARVRELESLDHIAEIAGVAEGLRAEGARQERERLRDVAELTADRRVVEWIAAQIVGAANAAVLSEEARVDA